MFTWHPSRKPSARLRRRLDRRTPADSLSICRPLPTVDAAHVRLSPAEQLGTEVSVAMITEEQLTPPDVRGSVMYNGGTDSMGY